ncbi:uncharacterized protein RSE6_14241 [Rhynchosporium secalis]|uniref:Uncharacterized protein n=1 Tax=Rhynchosporium secalis TaxID=38038 RepID=A0A1E1MUV9_RHYSE|nr:uncharacterized protein RSE6_14241 [Rhynchosporium secalis]
MAIKVLTAMLEASKGQALDIYQLGLTEIFIGADTLALLENERARRLDHYATVLQKNLKATFYRLRYRKARDAILFGQSIVRKHLAWKYLQKMKGVTTIQRIWRGQRQRRSLDVVWDNVHLIQAAAKEFLRRRDIMGTCVREAAVVIQKVWRSRRHTQNWRLYKRRVIIVQTLWRVMCARRRIRSAEAPSNVVSQGNHWFARLPAYWRIQLQRIKSSEVLEDIQLYLNKIYDRRRMGERRGSQGSQMVFQILRRVHLAELTAKYMEEVDAEKAEAEANKAAPKEGRQATVKERYVNLLFPHTIKHTIKHTSNGTGKGKEENLHAPPKGHDQAVIDYVDFCYPGLKEQMRNLSWVLRGIAAGDIPTKQLVIETVPSHDLSDYPFEELFRFSSDRSSSELGKSDVLEATVDQRSNFTPPPLSREHCCVYIT